MLDWLGIYSLVAALTFVGPGSIALDLPRDSQEAEQLESRLPYREERSFGFAYRFCCILRLLDNGDGTGGHNRF
jgi:hypothetical protein